MALYKQEKLGAYSVEKDTETGYLDIIGSDKRYVRLQKGCLQCISRRRVNRCVAMVRVRSDD